MDPTIFQKIITGVQRALEPGLATMRPFLLLWISALIMLEAMRVWGAVLEDGHRWQHGAGFLVRTLVFVAIYWEWPSIMTSLVADFAQAGIRFGGSQMTVQQFLDPGALLWQGITTAKTLKDITLAQSWITGAIYFLPFLVCWQLYIIAYAIMSVNVFLIQVEMSIVLPVSMLALGFMFWAPTRNLAAGVFSYALSVSMQFFAQAVLASLIFLLAPILTAAIPSTSAFAVAMEQAVIMVITAYMLAYLFWRIPGVISRHLSGIPTLSAGGMVQTISGLAGVATGGIGLLRAGVATGRAVGRGATRTATISTTPRPQNPAPPRSSLPPMPATQALNATLRAGAQWLGHDHSGGGPHVSL